MLPQLGAHDPADAGADGLAVLVDQYAGVVAERDDAAVLPLRVVLRAHHDGVADVATADFVGGGNGDAAAGFGTERALFLDDDDDAVT